ncbi:hypothetical protein K438DRAFT_1998850 [Mycena galopus ATCC 62051]|nr:hypothetical protein K438DRAFT_1998850 [Mycena galopus ATCC 62051]
MGRPPEIRLNAGSSLLDESNGYGDLLVPEGNAVAMQRGSGDRAVSSPLPALTPSAENSIVVNEHGRPFMGMTQNDARSLVASRVTPLRTVGDNASGATSNAILGSESDDWRRRATVRIEEVEDEDEIAQRRREGTQGGVVSGEQRTMLSYAHGRETSPGPVVISVTVDVLSELNTERGCSDVRSSRRIERSRTRSPSKGRMADKRRHLSPDARSVAGVTDTDPEKREGWNHPRMKQLADEAIQREQDARKDAVEFRRYVTDSLNAQREQRRVCEEEDRMFTEELAAAWQREDEAVDRRLAEQIGREEPPQEIMVEDVVQLEMLQEVSMREAALAEHEAAAQREREAIERIKRDDVYYIDST